MRLPSSRSTGCRSTSFRRPRPASPCRSIPAANTLDGRTLEALLNDLSKLCRVEVIGPCAAVSLVGRSIRATLHRLGDALELFEEQRIYLVTQAANDLNITFVVDEEQGDRLVRRLHDVIVWNAPSDHVLGPTWEQIHGLTPMHPGRRPAVVAGTPRRNCMRDRARARQRVRLRPRIARAARRKRLLGIRGIDRIFYAMKANPHPEILRTFAGARAVVRVRLARRMRARDRRSCRASTPSKILFTPNFAPRARVRVGAASRACT